MDTDRWFVVAANVLGGCQGSTGPSSARPGRPAVGIALPAGDGRDQVRAEALLADHLGIASLGRVIGGSMGGMRALEWLVGHPDAGAVGLLLATGAAATADQLGTQTAQIRAIEADPAWRGGDYYDSPPGPVAGHGGRAADRAPDLPLRATSSRRGSAARRRTARCAGSSARDGRFAVESYLDHHAAKLARRFDAGTYVALTDSMNTWDVGRGRGGVDEALASITVPTLVAGIDSDRLYPLGLQQQLAALIPGTVGGLRTVHSLYGHDGFLIEVERVAALADELLSLVDGGAVVPRPRTTVS